MDPEALELEGVVCSGVGEGAMFTQLDSAMGQFRAKLGFAPYPGTFNLRMQGPAWEGLRARLARAAGIAITPADGYCGAKCFGVTLDGRVRGAAVFPEVEGYLADKFEVIAPVAVRQALGVRDGDRVRVRVEIGEP